MSLRDYDAESVRGQALLASGDAIGAEAIQRAAVEACPDVANYQFRLAEALEALGRDHEAAACYFTAAELDSASSLFRQRAGALALRTRTVDEALTEFLRLKSSSPGPDQADHFVAVRLLAAGRPDLCQGRLLKVFGQRVSEISFSDQALDAESVRLVFEGGTRRIELAPGMRPWPFLYERLAAFAYYGDRIDNLHGGVRLGLGDGPADDTPQLCFSSDKPIHELVPDPIFLATGAYGGYREGDWRAPARGWKKRSSQAYWRGSLTGVAADLRGAMALPRVQLCVRGLFAAEIDAKITDAGQYHGLEPALGEALRGLGVFGVREDVENNLRHRFLVDIDGNTNAWQSLFTKFLAGGCVIKLRSPFRQWYYEQLQDRRNVLFIDDLAELPDVVRWGNANSGKAEEIAGQGRKLVDCLTYDSEWRVFADAVRRLAS
jgi:hypothetical protein